MSTIDLPETTEAMLLTEFEQPLERHQLPVPRKLEPQSLLVEVDVSTICGSDVHMWDGSVGRAMGMQLPVILGHEFVGRVVAIGENAELDSVGQPLSLGDRIVWTHESCGSCHGCVVMGDPSLCVRRRLYMFESPRSYPYLTGGFAQHCYVFPRSGRLRVPDGIDSSMASAASCALRTVVHGFKRLGVIEGNESFVIQGAGPVGLFATAVAKRRGARHVTVVGDPQSRLDVAMAWGADDVVHVAGHTAGERVGAVADLTGGGGDVVIEASGAQGAFGEGMQMLARGGRYLVIGQLAPNVEEITPSMITTKQATILGSLSGHTADYWASLQFLEKYGHELAPDSMITYHVDLDGATEALQRMHRFEEVKVAVHPHGLPHNP